MSTLPPPGTLSLPNGLHLGGSELLKMRVLFATDGSAGSAAAAKLLPQLVRGSADPVLLLTVAPAETAEEIFRRTAPLLESISWRLEKRVEHGDPARSIIRVAEESAADLVVLGSRGRAGLLALGSVAERVARTAHCPVLVVRGEHHHPMRVMVGIDASEHSERAAAFLRRLPILPSSEVRLLAVVPNLREVARLHLRVPSGVTTLDEQLREEARGRLAVETARFAAAGVGAASEIRSGDPSVGIVGAAVDEGTDLIVVGSHCLLPIERIFVGSVSEETLHNAPCSVLVVRESLAALPLPSCRQAAAGAAAW